MERDDELTGYWHMRCNSIDHAYSRECARARYWRHVAIAALTACAILAAAGTALLAVRL